MKTVTIRFVTTCPACQKTEQTEVKGLGQSHAEWISRLAADGKYPNWHCPHCKSVVLASLSNVETEEAGK